jgi:hypothetical protein
MLRQDRAWRARWLRGWVWLRPWWRRLQPVEDRAQPPHAGRHEIAVAGDGLSQHRRQLHAVVIVKFERVGHWRIMPRAGGTPPRTREAPVRWGEGQVVAKTVLRRRGDLTPFRGRFRDRPGPRGATAGRGAAQRARPISPARHCLALVAGCHSPAAIGSTHGPHSDGFSAAMPAAPHLSIPAVSGVIVAIVRGVRAAALAEPLDPLWWGRPVSSGE